MAKNDKLTFTPGLRFPEFAEAPLWQMKLGDVTEDCTERIGNSTTSTPIMGVSKTDGIVPMEERLIGKDTARYKCLENNWFAYNPMRLNIGSIARWVSDEDVLVSPDYVVFRCLTDREPGIDPSYLDQFRCSDQWARFVGGSGDGGVRIRIYFKDLARLPISLPSIAEQRKIAACLEGLDELIDAEAARLEALRSQKRGLMQQLFPKEGESLPRLRFPDFRRAGNWETRRLEEIADFQSGGTPSKSNPAFWNGSTPWVSAKDMKRMVLSDTEDHITDAAISEGAKVVAAGTVLMLTRGMTLLRDVPICLLDRPMAFNQDVRALHPSNGFDARFLAYMLVGNKHRILSMVDVAGHGTGRLNTDRLKSLELFFPSPIEQRHIAKCMSALDTAVAAQTRRVALLVEHKNGLMQQLFPAGEGIS